MQGGLQALVHVGVQDIPGNGAEETSLPGIAGLTELAVSGSYSCCGCFAALGRELRSRDSFFLGLSQPPTTISGLSHVWSAISGWDVSLGDSEHCLDLGPCL